MIHIDFRKMKWSLYEKDDLAKFKAELRGHTGAINVLLMTVQLNTTTIHGRRQEQQSKSIAARIQANSFAILDALRSITKNVTDLVDTTAKVL